MLQKCELKVLERIFAKEIVGQLPAQFKSKHLVQLQGRGYVQQVKVIMGGRFPVTVEGWVLTDRGRFEYCQSCEDVDLGKLESEINQEISTKNAHLKSHEKRAPRQRSGA